MHGLGIAAALGGFPEKFNVTLKQEKPSICDKLFLYICFPDEGKIRQYR